MKMLPKRIVNPATALLLFIALVLAGTGHLDRIVGAAGLAAAAEANDRYLENSFDRALKGFLVLSAIKSGVAILEGSEVGVGFSLEIGDIVQAVYDYVDVAWRVTLAGGTVLLLTRIILQALQAVDQWFLVAALGLWLAAFLTRWLAPSYGKPLRIFRECLLFVGSITIALYLLLPVSIRGASYLSARITGPLIEEAHAGFAGVQADLSPRALGERFFPDAGDDESLWARLDLREKLANSKQAMADLGEWFEESSEDFAIWTIQLIAGYVFDCVVFPLSFLFAVYLLTRALLGYLLGLSRRQALREDLEAVLGRYFGRDRDTEGGPDPDPTEESARQA